MDDNSEGLVERLFLALKHGDQDHQDWLREAITAFYADQPVPAPRGSGNKERRIATLEAALKQAALDLHEAAGRFSCISKISAKGCSELTREAAHRAEAALNKDQADEQI
jgi:hypothetical protein